VPAVNFDSEPAYIRWPVTRGDDENMPLQFFTTYVAVNDPGNDELDITGRSYASSVATGRGGTVVATPTVTVDDASLGMLTVSLTDTQTDALVNATYIWDLVENPGTTSESTLIVGPMPASGRATI